MSLPRLGEVYWVIMYPPDSYDPVLDGSPSRDWNKVKQIQIMDKNNHMRRYRVKLVGTNKYFQWDFKDVHSLYKTKFEALIHLKLEGA